MIHFWEAPFVSGTKGAGAVFFSGCPLGCCFCQNYAISRRRANQTLAGRDLTQEELATELSQLAADGVHNFNLVTASHYAPDIPELVESLRQRGITQPVIWNTSSYERVETLRLLQDSVDVYLPDFKFWDPGLSARLAQAPDYAQVASRAILEMQRQQPATVFNAEGLLIRGLAVRLLVLPGQYRDAMKIIDFLAANLPPDTPLAIMNQYTPDPENLQLTDHPELGRRLTTYEYQKVVEHAQMASFTHLIGQERASASTRFTPEF
jgi:putative pyruvate formate lyase activating enzyme